MNCLDFRRAIFTNPRQLDEGARAHSLGCAACHDFLEKQREVDAELFAALQVPPFHHVPFFASDPWRGNMVCEVAAICVDKSVK